MSLRKGSLEDYYNSVPGAKAAGYKIVPGVKPTCYQDVVERKTINKLNSYRGKS